MDKEENIPIYMRVTKKEKKILKERDSMDSSGTKLPSFSLEIVLLLSCI